MMHQRLCADCATDAVPDCRHHVAGHKWPVELAENCVVYLPLPEVAADLRVVADV